MEEWDQLQTVLQTLSIIQTTVVKCLKLSGNYQVTTNKKSDSISVYNDKNQLVDNESDKADIIRNYFELLR